MNLRHPDGASNPNLQEMVEQKKFNDDDAKSENILDCEDDESAVPLPLASELLTFGRPR